MGIRQHRKYARETIAKADPGQLCFTSAGSLESARIAVLTEQTGLDLSSVLFCPFCLIENKARTFLVSTKKGISPNRAQCPACGEGMLFRTLIRKWTAEVYAKWVFGYSHSGFWKKIKFETWKIKLYERGWAETFWDIYKQLKAENPREENYEDRMNRLGQEAAQQWQQNEDEGQVPDA